MTEIFGKAAENQLRRAGRGYVAKDIVSDGTLSQDMVLERGTFQERRVSLKNNCAVR